MWIYYFLNTHSHLHIPIFIMSKFVINFQQFSSRSFGNNAIQNLVYTVNYYVENTGLIQRIESKTMRIFVVTPISYTHKYKESLMFLWSRSRWSCKISCRIICAYAYLTYRKILTRCTVELNKYFTCNELCSSFRKNVAYFLISDKHKVIN